jgi:nucleoside-diphosphate-sugar epimerase
MKVALVGPTGVLGRSLVPLLLERGHQVRALGLSTEAIRGLFGDAVEAVACDLLAEGLESRLPGMLDSCQAAFHIATAIPRDFSAPGAWDTNTRLRTVGTRRLLDAVLEAGVRRYVQQSISLAYPDRGGAWIEEYTPLDESPERAEICDPSDLEWCILRGGTFVGPGTFQERHMTGLQAGRKKVPCDGSAYVSLVHVGDMARACAAVLEREAAGAILNINAEPIRQGDYLDRLALAAGAPLPERDPSQPCPPSCRCSTRAAHELLGWEAVNSVIP